MKDYDDNELNQIETDITQALLEAAEYKNRREERTVKILRGGKELFSFRITGLSEGQWRKCRRENLRNRGKRTEELDDFRFISQAIYLATVDEDKPIWKNQTVMEKLNAATPVDVVNAVLLPGEKSKLADVLIELSDYDDDLDELISN